MSCSSGRLYVRIHISVGCVCLCVTQNATHFGKRHVASNEACCRRMAQVMKVKIVEICLLPSRVERVLKGVFDAKDPGEMVGFAERVWTALDERVASWQRGVPAEF